MFFIIYLYLYIFFKICFNFIYFLFVSAVTKFNDSRISTRCTYTRPSLTENLPQPTPHLASLVWTRRNYIWKTFAWTGEWRDKFSFVFIISYLLLLLLVVLKQFMHTPLCISSPVYMRGCAHFNTYYEWKQSAAIKFTISCPERIKTENKLQRAETIKKLCKKRRCNAFLWQLILDSLYLLVLFVYACSRKCRHEHTCIHTYICSMNVKVAKLLYYSRDFKRFTCISFANEFDSICKRMCTHTCIFTYLPNTYVTVRFWKWQTILNAN